jgi:hypothetical protein
MLSFLVLPDVITILYILTGLLLTLICGLIAIAAVLALHYFADFLVNRGLKISFPEILTKFIALLLKIFVAVVLLSAAYQIGKDFWS